MLTSDEIQIAPGVIDDKRVWIATGGFDVDRLIRRVPEFYLTTGLFGNRGGKRDAVPRFDAAVGAEPSGVADVREVRGHAQVGAQLVGSFHHLPHLLERRVAVLLDQS